MSLAAVGSGRRLAESLMEDTATVARGGGVPVFDPVTGLLTPPAGSTVYVGPCRVRMPSLQEQVVVFGGTDVTRMRFLISFPWDVAALAVDDVVTVTVSEDPHIGQRAFRVTVVPSATFLMYRQAGVEVIE